MEQQLVEIREQQKASWNKFSPGWKKWDDLFMEFLQPIGDKIVDLLKVKSTDFVLDVASGTGEPGLTIAAKAKHGIVVITDLAEDMLEIAKENAAQRRIGNIETLSCDVCDLPFDDDIFDKISCRLGFMFFPDMLLAATEMSRVLKPGGKIATAVWNSPEKNFWITAMMGAINKNIDLPSPAPGAPGMFRCARVGLIADLFNQAGLKNISVTEVNLKLNVKTAETYWNVMTELAAPVVTALANVDERTRNKIKKEVIELVNQRYPTRDVLIDASSLVIYGEK
jgi:ubiquinone/menaquinone biosynthesis C-methylase UbiE